MQKRHVSLLLFSISFACIFIALCTLLLHRPSSFVGKSFEATRLISPEEPQGRLLGQGTSYVYGDRLIAIKKDEQISYSYQNNIDSNVFVTTQAGSLISKAGMYPFGKTLFQISTAEGRQKYLFTGKELDASLYLFGARYYDPRAGRFLSVDPAGSTYASYDYAGNNPIAHTDLTGLCTDCPEIGPLNQNAANYQDLESRIRNNGAITNGNQGYANPGLSDPLFSLATDQTIPRWKSFIGLVGSMTDVESQGNVLVAGMAVGVGLKSMARNSYRNSQTTPEAQRIAEIQANINRNIMTRDGQVADYQFEAMESNTMRRDPAAAAAFRRMKTTVKDFARSGVATDPSLEDLVIMNSEIQPGLLPEETGIRGIHTTRETSTFHGRIYYPSPYAVPGLMAQWYEMVDLVRRTEGPGAVPGVAREYLTKIHPCCNGNGRLGALVESYYREQANMVSP
jgi:RHS repeat-associated protein